MLRLPQRLLVHTAQRTTRALAVAARSAGLCVPRPYNDAAVGVRSSVPLCAAVGVPHRSMSTDAVSAAATAPGATPLSLYDAAIRSGQLREDARQRRTVELLDDIYRQLVQAKATGGNARPAVTHTPAPAAANHSGGGGGLFGFAKKLLHKPAATSSSTATTSASHSQSPFRGIRGLYLYGGVGSGKTMLMNQFYDCVVGQQLTRKTVRKHFHSFMLDIHRRLHEFRRAHPGVQDPLISIAREFVARECEVLALDEFQVTDVADAMILRQLFTVLWEEGCCVVATSNRPPEDLYKNGLNRQVFLPFIDELKKECRVHAVEEGQDHRLLGTIAEGVYHVGINASTSKAIASIFDRLAGSTDPERRGAQDIPVMMGRKLHVPLASANSNVAQFTFTQLCETNVGAADYIALVQQYKYILLTDIPILYFNQREKIRRFITFLDVAYEHHTRLIMQAEAEPLKLFQMPTSEMLSGSIGQQESESETREFEGIKAPATPPPSSTAVGATSSAHTAGAKYDEQFASSRAISRLIEMSSAEYLQACARARDSSAAPADSAADDANSLTRKHLENEKAAQRQQQRA